MAREKQSLGFLVSVCWNCRAPKVSRWESFLTFDPASPHARRSTRLPLIAAFYLWSCCYQMSAGRGVSFVLEEFRTIPRTLFPLLLLTALQQPHLLGSQIT